MHNNNVRISTIEELQAIVRRIQKAHPDLKLVFRGQTHNHDPVASAGRNSSNSRVNAGEAVIQSMWDLAASNLLAKYCISDKPRHMLAEMAILQHYGFKSWFVDVTSDPIIAAWFATHRYTATQNMAQPMPLDKDNYPSKYLVDRAISVISCAKYVRNANNDGYFYVFGLSQGYIDTFFLSNIFTGDALRIHRQKAGELIVPYDRTPISSLVLETIVIDNSIILPEEITSEYLFPFPSEDLLYRDLLRIPYVANEKQMVPILTGENPNGSILAYPLIDVPLFNHEDCFYEEYAPTIRNVIGHYPLFSDFELFLIRRKIIILPFSRFPNTGYHSSLDDYSPDEKPSEDTDNMVYISFRARRNPLKDVNLNVWGSERLFLVYPISQMIPSFLEKESIYPIFRGVFVDINNDSITKIEYVCEGLDGVFSCEIKPEKAKEETLEDFYFLTEKLELGKAVLVEQSPFVSYEWTNWDTRRHGDPLEDTRMLFEEVLS